MVKVKLGLRWFAIILFSILYLGSIILINSYNLKIQKNIKSVLTENSLDNSLNTMCFSTTADSLKARKLIHNHKDLTLSIEGIQAEGQTYSAIFLFIIMTVAITAFILIINKLTKPLVELEKSAKKVAEGDFSASVPISGIPEIKRLQKSFNKMTNELETTQNRLLVAEKEMMWKELSRILAHEIKNPLTPIQLSVQRLEEKFDIEPEKFNKIFPECAKVINQEVENLRLLVMNFSRFAKIEVPKSEKINPANKITEILDAYKHSVDISYDLDFKLSIIFDPTHFYQIVTNIFQNATQACENNCKICVSLKKSNSYAVLTISDNGCGISSNDLSKIFEPYFSRKKKGTGLGLALVKRLAEANRAMIRVKSKVNEGTSFEIIMENI